MLNVFNQKTARHIFDNVNRPRRASSAINLASTDLAAGLRLQRADRRHGPMAPTRNDPRYGMDDLFNPGLQARFSVRFLF